MTDQTLSATPDDMATESAPAPAVIESATGRIARRALFLLFLVSLPAVTPRIYASDEIEYFAFLRSWRFDRDLSFQNEYQHFYDAGIGKSPAFHETFLERTTETGRRINFGTIGCALLWAPFYGVADTVAHLLHKAGYAVEPDGYSFPYVAAIAYGSAMYGFLSLVFAMAIVRRVVGPGARLEASAAAAVWLGTPLLFYMYVAPAMSHAASAFAVSAFVLCWLKVRGQWSMSGLIALGALAGLMTIVREQDLFFAAGPALDFGGTVLRHHGKKRLLAHGAIGALAFGVVFAPQAAAYLVLNGRIGPSPLVSRKMNWAGPHVLEVLASDEHGLFFWTPLAVIGIAGIVVLAMRGSREHAGASTQTAAAVRPPRSKVSPAPAGMTPGGLRRSFVPGTSGLLPIERQTIARCMLAMIALQVYVAGSVESWTGAGGFGQRRFVALTPLLAVGLAVPIQMARTARSRRLLALAVVLCVWWNVGLMAQFGSGLMDRQRLDIGRIAYNNFVLVPQRLPALAYRYAFDRRSFYQPPATGR